MKHAPKRPRTRQAKEDFRNMSDTPNTQSAGGFKKFLTAIKPHLPTVATVLVCILLIPIILFNVIMSIQSIANPDVHPSFFGYAPHLMTSDYAEPTIQKGDLVFCKVADASEINEGDVIMYFVPDPANKGKVRIQEVTTKMIYEDGARVVFLTKDINAESKNGGGVTTVPAENLIGIYKDNRIPALGAVLAFMGSVTGILICVGVPLLIVIGYMIFKGMKKSKETDDLKAELERLRREKEALAQDAPPADEASPVNEEAPIEEAPAEQAREDGED